MIFRKVQSSKIMPIVLYFGAFGYVEPNSGKDVDNLILNDGDRMSAAEVQRFSRSGEIAINALCFLLVFQYLPQGVHLFGSNGLKLVYNLTELLFLFGGYVLKIRKEMIEQSL